MSSSAAKPVEAPPPSTQQADFAREVQSRLTDQERATLRRLRWLDRCTSLWAPVTLFGLMFALYLLVVELYTPSHTVLQPALKGFGLLMLVAYLGLILARVLWARFGRLRKLRHQADELGNDVARLIDKNRSKLSPKGHAELLANSTDVLRAVIAGNADKLGEQLDKLHSLSEKHVGAWRHHGMLEFVLGFAKALAVALLIRAVVLEPFKIPSGSMIPTLEIGDQIFVNKFIYGVRLPWVNVVPFVIVREPKRGDVIVFNNPVEPDKDYVKRVVGLPGDRIALIDKVVHVNGQPMPVRVVDESYTFQDQKGGAWEAERAQLVEERFDGEPHLTLRADGLGSRQPPEGEWVVPPKHVFVLGDNRDNSMDSRLGLGRQELGVQYVPYGNIKGKAMVIWLSLSHEGLFHGFFGGTGLRTDRLFRPVR